jgi:signal transduction histidine kinase
MLVVGLAPIALSAQVMLPASEAALRARIDTHQADAARYAAGLVAARLVEVADALGRSASFVDLERAPEAVVQGVLRVIYRGSPELTVVSAFAADGAAIAPSVYLAAQPDDADLAGRRALGAKELGDHAAELRPAEIRRLGRWWSDAYAGAQGMRMAVGVTAASGAAGRPAAEAPLLVAEIDLERLADEVAAVTIGAGEGLLWTRNGRGIGAAAGVELGGARETVLAGRDRVGEATMGGERFLTAYAPARATGLGVIVRQRLAVATAPIAALSRRLWYALGVAFVLVALLAAALTRSITGRIARLGERVATLERGEYALAPLDLGGDEVGRLGRAFDRMAAEVRRRQEDVLELNRTLEARVEARTEELRRVEQQLARAERLAAVGTLGAGFAHEINNPLASVLGLAQILGARTPEDDPRRRSIALIEQETQRIARIVARVLELSEEARPPSARVEIADIVARALERAAPPSGVTVRTDVLVGDAALSGSRDALAEALEQLVRNAAEALEGGGTIEITARADDRAVTLSVRDDGPGIAPDALPRIFDPFFTTKHAARAPGLGLSLVHRTVTGHHGDVSIKSELGKGTTARMVLPRWAARSLA